ncbi:MAG TPA: hypothetical protein VIK40_07845 [Geomonas sp.]
MKMNPQPSQRCIEGRRKVDELPAAETKGQLRIGLKLHGHNRLLVFQGANPLVFAHRLIFNTVRRHDENEAVAGADRFIDRYIPITHILQQIAFIYPDNKRWWTGSERISQTESKFKRLIRFRIADKVVSHCPPPWIESTTS